MTGIVSRTRRMILAIGVAAFLAPGASFAQQAEKVTVNVFPGGFNWGIYVGQDKGFFKKRGIEVEIQGTPNSVAQMTGLSTGAFDIAMTAVDNIVAYVEGQGEAPIGPQPDFVAVMGSDSGFLSLVTSPDVADIASLRGRTLSVDARTTGYAFVLFDILQRAGLKLDADYEVLRVGGMVQRWEALRDGKQAGTLLSAPYNILARAAGLKQQVTGVHAVGAYQGNVAAVRRSWAAANWPKVLAYIRGYVELIEWLYDKANRQDAIAILRRALPQMPQDLAEKTYDELLDPQEGFFRGGKIDEAGMRTVLDLRSRYAQPQKSLTDPSCYIDTSFVADAMK